MIEIIIAAGWPIWPIIFCSVISVAIIAERFYSLRREAVVPNNLLEETVSHLKTSGVTQELISKTGGSSPLGRVFVAGLRERKMLMKLRSILGFPIGSSILKKNLKNGSLILLPQNIKKGARLTPALFVTNISNFDFSSKKPKN